MRSGPALDSLAIVRVSAAAFLAAHLAPALTATWWGIDSLHDAPATARIAFAIAGLLVVLAPARIADAARGRTIPRTLGAGLLVAAATFFFATRPAALPLLGDGFYQWHDLERIAGGGDWSIRWAGENAPLCTWLRVHGFDLLHPLGVAPETFLRGASVLSGVVFAAAAIATANTFAAGAGSWFVALLLLSGGFMQLFCGYIETYPLIAPVILLYLRSAGRAAQGARLWQPALWLGLLVAMHFSMLALIPSLFVLAAWPSPSATRRSWLRGAAWTAGAVAFAGLVLAAIGFDAAVYANVPRDSIAPVRGALGFRDNWHLFSLAHAFDVCNQMLLAAPGVLLSAVLLRRATAPAPRFLAAAAAFPATFLLLANPEVGAFRDWDVFALPGLILTAWVAVSVASRTENRARLLPAGFVIGGACALHTFAWTSLNADASRSEARFERLLETATLSRHARAYGWETLAGVRRDRGEAAGAATAWERAARNAGDNPRLWVAAAEAQLQQGRDESALEAWRRALECDPRNADAHFGTGTLAFRRGDIAAAERHFRAAVASRPAFSLAHYNLGLALLRSGNESAAVASLSQSVRTQPDFALGWETLGAVHRSAGRVELARRCFEAAIALRPSGPDADRMRGWLRELASDFDRP